MALNHYNNFSIAYYFSHENAFSYIIILSHNQSNNIHKSIRLCCCYTTFFSLICLSKPYYSSLTSIGVALYTKIIPSYKILPIGLFLLYSLELTLSQGAIYNNWYINFLKKIRIMKGTP